VKVFVTRHPLGFSLLLTGALLGLAFASRVALPTHTVSSVADLPSDLGPLSDRELALFTMRSSETLFYVLTSLLVIVLVTWLDWWREAGFNRPSRWRNPHLLLFPLLVSALTLLGGIRVPGPAFFISMLLVLLLAAFSEEALYRGIAWRALLPKKGVIQAVITTSLLFGVLRFGRFVFGGPWPEAFYLRY
jgi:membrane protease YdiL (CAAX protease family)